MTCKVIFLIGAAGSGKSTVGQFLASTLHYCYLDKDVVSNRFTGALLQLKGYQPNERDECAFYKDKVMVLEYQTLLHLAGENLKLGNSVVLDAPFLSYFRDPDFVSRSIQQFGWGQAIKPIVLQVSVQPEILKQRIVSRNNERDKWKLDNWNQFISGIEQNKCLWQGVTYVNFDNSIAELDKAELLNRITSA